MQQDSVRRAYTSDIAGDGTGDAPLPQWRSRPVAAATCRTAIALAPLSAAAAITVSVQLWVFGPLLSGQGLLMHAAAYVVLAAATTGIGLLVERVARRALPLVPLLRLTMLFPDEAPSRFQMARTAGNPAALARLAERGDEQGAAAVQVLALLTRLSEHERRTRGHSERVRVYADLLGEELGLSPRDRDRLRLAALVHDVGKLTVPAEVLTKPSRPTTQEWANLQSHPEAGIELAGPLAAWLGPWTGSINEHHERFDGTGYPRKLAGDEISLAGRIVAVADAFETMTANRSYKKPMSTMAARQELTDCAGTHFDPAVVRAFMDISLPRLRRRTLAAGIFLHIPVLGTVQTAGAGLASSLGPVGTSVVASIGAGPASAAVMTVLATTVALGVVPAAAATGPSAHSSGATSISPHPDAAPLSGGSKSAASAVSTPARPTSAATLPSSHVMGAPHPSQLASADYASTQPSTGATVPYSPPLPAVAPSAKHPDKSPSAKKPPKVKKPPKAGKSGNDQHGGEG